MGELLKVFTFDRNTLKSSELESAVEVETHINLALSGRQLSKIQSNIVTALRSYIGALKGEPGGYALTPAGELFLSLFAQSKEDAWRWLLTRALWRYVLPNGTAAKANQTARDVGVTCSLFALILGVLQHLSSLPGDQRYFYFEELREVFEDDTNWNSDALTIFLRILEIRNSKAKRGESFPPMRTWLEDLEPGGRDNLNTYFCKAFRQTGLFDPKSTNGLWTSNVSGIALSSDLDPVLQRRVRVIVDNPLPPYTGGSPDADAWAKYLRGSTQDLPNESVRRLAPPFVAANLNGLDGIVFAATKSFQQASLRFNESLIPRIVSSLLAKPFLILTGLSGSGKSKIAEALATWLCQRYKLDDPFIVGKEIKSERISYTVTKSEKGFIELSNGAEAGIGALVGLPRGLIKEWADHITSHNLTREVSCRGIKEAVVAGSAYAPQLHSFETHLKAAAFALVDAQQHMSIQRNYALVSVGSDWNSNENVLGYQDALSTDRYRKPTSGILDLILLAQKDRANPYFLILDEMNLSHVERYFADILSAIESKQSIALHSSDKDLPAFDNDPHPVPSRLSLPPNLFIIGTVNVDETTYMFSPKVLDRANVIEFRVAKDEMADFLGAPKAVDMEGLAGGGAAFGEAFVAAATSGDVSAGTIPEAIRGATDVAKDLNDSLLAAFDGLAEIGAEFGYRTAYEISRFVYLHAVLSGAGWQFRHALDAQVFQKLLPKLHGSERRLGPVLEKLDKFCTENNLELSLEKIKRMRERLKDGFTSFAEA